MKNRGKEFNATAKMCTKCSVKLPLDEEHFKPDKAYIDGYRNICRECAKKKSSNVERGCIRKPHKLYNLQKWHKWTQEEDDILMQNFSTTSCKDMVNLIPNHTYNSIRSRAYQEFNLCKDKDYLKEKYWAKEQDDYLLSHYASTDMKDMMLYLSKTSTSIVVRASKLGVCKDTFWSDLELIHLKEHFPNMSTIEFRNKYMPKRSIVSINNQVAKYKIFKTQEYLNTVFKSNGEFAIATTLDSYNIPYKREYKFGNLISEKSTKLRLDFYLKEYNLCVEYNGIQHYEPVERFGGEEQFKTQQENDKKKIEYCKRKGIELLIIPYWEFHSVEEILLNKIMQIDMGTAV
jgi:hypothetical protein